MLVFELHVTSSRGLAACTIIAVAFAIALVSGAASAQSPASDPSQSETKAPEQPKENPARSTASATEVKPAERRKRPAKPFIPTERIDADSVISFPTNI